VSSEQHDMMPRHAAKPVFRGSDGEAIPGWMVPLDKYVEAHEEWPGNDWVRAHMIVVARALVHGLPVPPAIVAQHDQEWLAATVEREREFHDHAIYLCPECRIQEA
jgi:hypothetical protein